MRLLVGWKSFSVRTLLSRGNGFELIPTIRMDRGHGHSVDGSFSCGFSSIYMVRELWPSEVRSRSRCYRKTWIFGKKILCGKILKISFQNDSPLRRSTSCMQISWNLAYRKSVKSCVIYQTKKFRLALSLSRSRFCAGRAQNLPGPAATNVLTVPQIPSKSVHFRRSYNRTRERRSNAPQSVSNTRRSFSFFA